MSYSGSSAVNGRRYDDDGRGESSSRYHNHKKSGSHHSESSRHNSHNSGGGGSSSYDSEGGRVQALSMQLAAAQSQVMQLELEIGNTRTAKSHAEHRLMTLQRENNNLQRRNVEVIEVMKTLELGVEALQREKNALATDREELKAKLEASEKNSAVLTEQVTYLNERNNTLSKKCQDLLDGSKDFREKAIAYENELRRIKPRYEEMEARFGVLEEQNKNFSTRVNMFEMRERIWIREKTEMEERHQMVVANFQKIIAEFRVQHADECTRLKAQQQQQMCSTSSAPPVTFYNANTSSNSNKMEMEKQQQQQQAQQQHIKDLHQLLESLQRHHTAELTSYKQRLIHLENLASEHLQLQQQQKRQQQQAEQAQQQQQMVKDANNDEKQKAQQEQQKAQQEQQNAQQEQQQKQIAEQQQQAMDMEEDAANDENKAIKKGDEENEIPVQELDESILDEEDDVIIILLDNPGEPNKPNKTPSIDTGNPNHQIPSSIPGSVNGEKKVEEEAAAATAANSNNNNNNSAG